jgi:hypothetical protein
MLKNTFLYRKLIELIEARAAKIVEESEKRQANYTRVYTWDLLRNANVPKFVKN